MQEITVALLYELQEVLDQEQEHKTRLKQLGRNLDETEKKMAKAEKDFALVKSSFQKLKISLEDINMQLSTLEVDKKKYETELYSPKNSNPKLLKDIEKKLSEIRKKIEDTEDRVFNLMDSTEKANKLKLQKEMEYQETTSTYEDQKKAVSDFASETQVQLKNLQQNKETIEKKLPSHYIEAFKKAYLLQNKAVAAVLEDECCSICKFQVSKRSLEAGKKNPMELYYCENCSRILYFKA
jgi:predicted  nucleic acid-binding Zn-ribbon protein